MSARWAAAWKRNKTVAFRRRLSYLICNQEVAYADRIEKAIELNAPVSRLWRALTDYREFGSWFRVRLDGPGTGHGWPDHLSRL
jgi:hypothetical protein